MKVDVDIWMKDYAYECLVAIGVKPGQKVLDFGCGGGAYSIPAARIVGKQGRVYAVDANRDTLDAMQRLADSEELTQVETVDTQGKVQVPLEDGSVDVVFLHDVVHLIGWEEREGRTVRRSTATDRKPLFEEVYRLMTWDGVLSVFSPHLATHTDISRYDDLRREIRAVGFRLEKETYRQVMHDGSLQKGHLYAFRKRHTSEVAPETFVYDSPLFQTGLKQDAHHYGEVTVLEAMAEPGMVVLELGSNRGVTALALAKRVGPRGEVYAFEPVPEYFAALVENLRLNGVENVRAHQFAVTDAETEVPYYKHGEGSGIVPEDGSDRIQVGTTSIDNFVRDQGIDRVDAINMDCEGAELFALRGAEETLRKDAPRIFCEIHHGYLASLGQSVNEIVEYLHALGFQVMPVSVQALGEDAAWDECTHICAATDEVLARIRRIGPWHEKHSC